ncbi:hypothetical protein ALC56_12002 [Trachymyrmex septentrionalis]|uniref:Uncharacterized protein n=1 Tax=Trachymyrmex septentrionalis TaxID=34720 RepID=A0A195F0V8_9HYME|nr:hypothetical protein ALC56_12002 [Trachymyrmex septentrionalis]
MSGVGRARTVIRGFIHVHRKWADIVPYRVKPLLKHCCKAESWVQLAEKHSSFPFANSARLLTHSSWDGIPEFSITLLGYPWRCVGIDGARKRPVLEEHEPNQPTSQPTNQPTNRPTDRPTDQPLRPRQAGGGVILEEENRVYRPLTSFIPTKLRHVYPAASPSA